MIFPEIESQGRADDHTCHWVLDIIRQVMSRGSQLEGNLTLRDA